MQDTQFKNELIDIDLEGKTLPAVTSADEGKVLAVDSSGEWAAEMPSGDKVYFCTSTESGLAETYNDLLTKLNNGISVFVFGSWTDSDGSYHQCLMLTKLFYETGQNTYTAIFCGASTGDMVLHYYVADSDETPLIFD